MRVVAIVKRTIVRIILHDGDRISGHHLIGNLSLQDPFTASSQSFDALFRRLFVLDAASNPRPWHAYRFEGRGGFLLLAMVVVCVSFVWSRTRPTAAAADIAVS